MTLKEFAVLEALNIAGAIHQRCPPKDVPLPQRRWYGHQATTAQIAEVLRDDPRMRAAGLPVLTERQVAGALGRMHFGPPARRTPLVERPTTRTWRMTDAGLKALSA